MRIDYCNFMYEMVKTFHAASASFGTAKTGAYRRCLGHPKTRLDFHLDDDYHLNSIESRSAGHHEEVEG
jgi:hypothetical protein